MRWGLLSLIDWLNTAGSPLLSQQGCLLELAHLFWWLILDLVKQIVFRLDLLLRLDDFKVGALLALRFCLILRCLWLRFFMSQPQLFKIAELSLSELSF
jgi:hypothetical protein